MYVKKRSNINCYSTIIVLTFVNRYNINYVACLVKNVSNIKKYNNTKEFLN